jgi:hypothetical protein
MSPALASRQRRRIIDDASQGLGMSRGAHLSIRGGRLRLINANGDEKLLETHHLDVVVIDANDRASRLFFDPSKPFDPTAGDPPLCFSDNGTGPSQNAIQPQSPTCQLCPNNVRGSDVTFSGKPTTACSNRKKLAFIVPYDPAVNVYEMQIPPGSLTGLRDYTNWLKQQASGIEGRSLDIADVVTRVSFDPDRQFVMKFTAVGYADDDYTLKVIDYIDANKLSDVAVGRNDVACDPEQVKVMLAGGGQRQALAAPAAEPRDQNFGSLPPRTMPQRIAQEHPVERQAVNEPGPAQEAPKPTRSRAKPKEDAAAANGGAAPFMAPARSGPAADAPSSRQEPTSTALRTAPSGAADDGIPSFLRRTSEAPAPSAPTPRFGVGNAPKPPGPILDAVNAAMNLPTRRG